MRSVLTLSNIVIGVMLILAIVAGVVAVMRMDPWAERQSSPPDDAIDPALIRYEQTGRITVPMRHVQSLAVGPHDQIYVAGDKAIRVFARNRAKYAEIALKEEPKCIAVGGEQHVSPGRIYVGMEEHVEVLDADGTPLKTWETLGEGAMLTAIALGEEDVFLADAGNRIVWRFDASGKLKGRIGAPDKARNIPGFVIPSRYFDAAVGPDGLLYVVNPRALKILAFTPDGDLEFSWGSGSPTIEGFCGCCNPAHFTILTLPDRSFRFVTAEKGIPRVKVYSAKGEFECVVAGPEQVSSVAVDVAADRRGRILVLDPAAGSVRIFERKKDLSGAAR
jgi:hypothetical protein